MKRPVSQDRTAAVSTHRHPVLLVDDHACVREGLMDVINDSPDLIVCGEAATAREALQRVLQLKPHVIVIDLTLREGTGLELIKSIRAVEPAVPILVLSMHDECLYAQRALNAGAQGYAMKSLPLPQVLQALRQILNGEIFLSAHMTRFLVERAALGAKADPAPMIAALNDRELEIFRLIGQGQGTREIAITLTLSPKTVASYREKIKHKLDLKNGPSLVRSAIQWARQQKMT